VRVSQATAEQRAGRAGRTAPGVAIRLWHEGQTRALPPFDPPEIERTDLRRFVLDCAVWGTNDPASLPLLDQPPSAALAQAQAGLIQLGALSKSGQLTSKGKRIARIPLPVPLAASVAAAANAADAEFRAIVAMAIVDLAPKSRQLDLEIILSELQSGRFAKRGQALQQRAKAIAARLKLASGETEKSSIGRVLMDAFPDRIAMRRGAQAGSFLMANGRGVRVSEEHKLAAQKFLVIVDVIGSAAQGRVMLAASLHQAEIEEVFAEQFEKNLVLSLTEAGGMTARREKRLGALVLSTRTEPLKPSDELEEALCALVSEKGFSILPMRETHLALLGRLNWLYRTVGAPWLDFSEEILTSNTSNWLKPFLAGKTSLAEISGDELRSAVVSRLPADLIHALDDAAPVSLKLPTGRFASLKYKSDQASPVLSVRVQELFGLGTHPCINKGRTPVLIEMLSPAQRPIQMTLDLPGFWAGSWADVRKDMRGRYPKHFWPNDPANATATDRAKPRK
ncbi:MAG: ATP-dependent helicase C-terminal domain-containing protein, partial [Pseudomonadota bacterium]